ncbi:MAG: HpcH/HpaI aldolase/citrate lyase family protein [Candidatus Hodarchaeota archaeon]
MKQVFENRVKRMLKEGKKTAGGWLNICSPFTAEIMSRAGFDWLLIDMEHGPGDILMLIAQLQAMNGSGVVPLVRAPWNDFATIKRILDAGAYGVMIPYVNTKADAEAAVRACKYPPDGIRGVARSTRAAGFGQNSKEYLTKANDEILIIVLIETSQGISNLDQILDVPGVDAFFIGPMDLAASMGYLGEANHPEVQSAIATIEAKVLKKRKALGRAAYNWEQAKNLYGRGYQMLSLVSDGGSLRKLATEIVAKYREIFPDCND